MPCKSSELYSPLLPPTRRLFPHALHSDVRQAMVKIMLNSRKPHPKRRATEGRRMGKKIIASPRPAFDARLQPDEGCWGATMVGREVPKLPATCMLWSAVALGSLVRGQPMKHVSTVLMTLLPPSSAVRTPGAGGYLNRVEIYHFPGGGGGYVVATTCRNDKITSCALHAEATNLPATMT